MNLENSIEHLEVMRQRFLESTEKAMLQRRKTLVDSYSKDFAAVSFALGALKGLEAAAEQQEGEEDAG